VDDREYFTEDAADRRAALAAATEITAFTGGLWDRAAWLHLADRAYRWLKGRDSLRAVTLQITPGTPRKEGSAPVATVYSLADTDEVPFTLTGLDAKGAAVPLPDSFTAAWSLADPDASGAVLTVSDDTFSAVLSAGVPDTNLMVSVSISFPNPDGSTGTLAGAEAVIVTATAAATVGIVAGTPSPEPAPAG